MGGFTPQGEVTVPRATGPGQLGDKMGPGDVGLSSGHSQLHQLSRGSRGRMWQISQLTKSPLCPVAVLYHKKPKQLAFLGDTLENLP